MTLIVDKTMILEYLFRHSYKVFSQYVISCVVAFLQGFKVSIIVATAVTFLLISVARTIRQVRKLPKSYLIEIYDVDGKLNHIDGLRQTFSTYEGGAVSYARFIKKCMRVSVNLRSWELRKSIEKLSTTLF